MDQSSTVLLQLSKTNKIVWDNELFERKLSLSHELSLQEHPHEIRLGSNWHTLFGKFRQKTSHTGREWSTKIVALDRFTDNQLSTPVVDFKEYFPEYWGTDEHPMFQTYLDEGGISDTGDRSSFVPPVITWDGEDIPTRTVSHIHSHTSDLPLSVMDMCLANTKNLPLSTFVVTPKHIFLLIRSEPLGKHDIEAVQKETKESTTKAIHKMKQPNVLFRLFGMGDPSYNKDYINALTNVVIEFSNKYKLSFYKGESEGHLMKLS